MKTFKHLIIFLSFAGTLYSQTNGFMGKKLIIKTNLVNGTRFGFNNIDIEYSIARRITVNLGFQTFNYSLSSSGISVKTGKIIPGNNRDAVQEISTLRNGTTKGRIISAGLRLYFNRIIPAPYGFYTELNVGFGSATYTDFQATYGYKIDDSKSFHQNTEYHPRADSPLFSGKSSIIFFELPSFGYQFILKRLITLDAKVALQGQYTKLPDDMLNVFEPNCYLRTNTIGFPFGALNLGPALYVKLGILLF